MTCHSLLKSDLVNYNTCQSIIGMVDGWHGSPGGLNNFSWTHADFYFLGNCTILYTYNWNR